MFLDHYNDPFHRARASFSVIVTPIQFVVNLPIALTDSIITALHSQHSLLEQNANLTAEMIILKSQLQKEAAIEAENQQLRELLKSTDQSEDWVSVAQLLAVSLEPFVHQVVINKGANYNIYVGQPVLDSFGVMGQVVQVGPLTSRVLLLTDSQSAIPVQDQRNGLRAIAVGDAQTGMLGLQNVTVNADFQQGDLLITSGLGGGYPFGYPVGTIVSIDRSSGNQFSEIIVKPSAHLDRSRLVLLIWVPKIKISPEIKQGLSQKKQTKGKSK